ncbi:MAG: PACE efflux transporter [Burkholderiaceae bacterium]|mgnify:CR=1 FL=1|nr:PACE efflux transporter [Pseudomonadota bacterium]MBS0598982.1 PACE efflux transporter [Pseudomonadota bacterium]MCO5117354.1 PACE efflux transporter [Burkholderiaceae bacterium]MCP5216827.1 PACE efflux transporter [Burkholderiaceae bacterium]
MSASPSPLLFPLQGPRRRVAFVTIYELIAIVVTTLGFMGFTDSGVAHSGVISAVSSAIAVAWNVGFNALFERWESRQARRGRNLARRVAHAIGFEGGLALLLVPLFAWWFDVGLWQALVMDLGLMLFFLVYTFVFNWGFDHVFGLPASAV